MIPLEDVAAWVLDELEDSDAEQVEEHLFVCGSCNRTARILLELRDAIPVVARTGRVRLALTRALLQRIDEDGLPVRRYDISPGDTVPCAADAEQVYSITRTRADLEGVSRVDVELLAPGGFLIDRLEDVPFDARLGAVVFAERGDSVRAWPTMTFHIRLIGHDASGTRELGVYGMSHSAS
jgi:hypothetical protein